MDEFIVKMILDNKQEIMTANQRIHHIVRANKTRNLREKSKLLHRGCPKFERAKLTIWLSFPDKRKRDVLNYANTGKALVDGAIPYILDDDSNKYLPIIDYRMSNHRSAAGTVGVTMRWERRPADFEIESEPEGF